MSDPYFGPHIVHEMAARFGLDVDTLKAHEGFSSYVYEGQGPTGRAVLKISHSLRIDREHLEAELLLTAFLVERGIDTPAVLEANSGERIVAVHDGHGGIFAGYAHRFVDGPLFTDVDKTPSNLDAWGALIGEVHHCGQSFAAQNPSLARPHLSEADAYDFERFVPREEVATHRVFQNLVTEISSIPRTASSYGLCHGDPHDGNLIFDGERLWIIDFDDCLYGHYLNDLAIAVYTSFAPQGVDQRDHTEAVFSSLVAGYLRTGPSIPLALFEYFPLFLKLRILMIHTVSAQLAEFKGGPDADEEAGLARRRARIESGFADMDFMMSLPYVDLARRASG